MCEVVRVFCRNLEETEMTKRILQATALIVGIASIVPTTLYAHEEDQTRVCDAEALLRELGEKLKDIPKRKSRCLVLLEDISAWQQEKLKRLEALTDAITITGPEEGDEVPEHPTVSGTVCDTQARVWVVVHPMEVADYWIQPSVAVKADGTWRAVPYIGRPGDIDKDKHFEVRAVANPREPLKEGMILGGWPQALWASEVIELVRK